MSSHVEDREVFIRGETIALCVPDEAAIEHDGWASWFNDVKRMRNTTHAIFPNTKAKQHEILRSIEGGSKISLLICHPETRVAHGIVTLHTIDMVSRSAEIVIHIGPPKADPLHKLAALEAMARISEHGFEELGLNRIYAGQSYPSLKSWNRALELIGFKTEGILRQAFVRGHTVTDAVQIACLYEDFRQIKAIRGSLWGKLDAILETMRRQPRQSHAELVDAALRDIAADYYGFLALDESVATQS